VFGWEYEPSHNPRARQVPGATPPQGLWGGQPRTTLFCSYVVDDAVAAAVRVRAAGGQAGDPVQRPYGLVADCTDNQGTRFAVHQYPAAGQPGAAAAGPAAAPRDGDLAYITFEVADSRLARDFYGAVLGWRFAPGSIADGWQVEGTTPMAGLSGGHAEATTVPMWRVADLQATVGRVRAAGGTAAEPRQEPYGLTADCTDDQGTRFYLGQFPAG
jgi:predicted enzyme related to lactoylglutathione lyase